MATQLTRYSLTKKIPTVDVDVPLLKNIESYILSNIPQMFEIDELELSSKYYTRIKDTNGELSLGLIEQYDNTMFPDSTTRITVGVRTTNYKSKVDIDISVTFDKDALFSVIQIDLFDLNPKEKAVGILTKLENIINEAKNLNFLFHPPLLINILLVVIGYSIPTLASLFFKLNQKVGYASLIVGLCIASYFWLFKKWKPYVSFISNRQKRNDRIANYLLLGILSFILFSTILMLIRKYFIGQ
ncbi:MAG: hypothetical protein JST58_03745 [Bacteroidetes bacterium]|nr:hypothetical protein [Bacteroidota bacterium]